MIYQLRNGETGDMVDAFAQADSAYCTVRDAIARHGIDYVEAWALECEAATGVIVPVAEGWALHQARHEAMA